MDVAKTIGLTNVGLWILATWRLVMMHDARVFAKLLLCSVAVDFLKLGFRQPRPLGARGCDALGISGPSKSFGMPSGHVATAVAGWVMVAQTMHASKTSQALVALIAAVLMGWARVKVGCHTAPQAAMGALFGWVVASVA